jgi:hypothetical protein
MVEEPSMVMESCLHAKHNTVLSFSLNRKARFGGYTSSRPGQQCKIEFCD